MSLSNEYSQADVYLHLPKREKREFEKQILNDPYSLSIGDMRTLYDADFPFRKFDRQWIGNYLALVDFHNFHNHLKVQPGPLKRWIVSQRSRRFRGKMLLGRERALNRINFTWDHLAVQWESQFTVYKAYVQSEGKVRSTSRLRSWASTIRKNWSKLPESRKRQLIDLNFDIKPKESIWIRNVEELEQIHASTGRLLKLNARLSQFVRRMRHDYQSGRLSNARKKRLERAGMSWISSRSSVPKDQFASFWEMRCHQTQSYLERNPELCASDKWADKILFRWVRRQWTNWQSLSPFQQDRLRLLNLEPSNGYRIYWDLQYHKAQKLFAELGDFKFARYYKANRNVARWLQRQLGIKTWKGLQPDQKQKISALGVKFEPGLAKAAKWENGNLRALRYASEGSLFGSVIQRSMVRRWIKRQAKRSDRLNAEQREKLLHLLAKITPEFFPIT